MKFPSGFSVRINNMEQRSGKFTMTQYCMFSQMCVSYYSCLSLPFPPFGICLMTNFRVQDVQRQGPVFFKAPQHCITLMLKNVSGCREDLTQDSQFWHVVTMCGQEGHCTLDHWSLMHEPNTGCCGIDCFLVSTCLFHKTPLPQSTKSGLASFYLPAVGGPSAGPRKHHLWPVETTHVEVAVPIKGDCLTTELSFVVITPYASRADLVATLVAALYHFQGEPGKTVSGDS